MTAPIRCATAPTRGPGLTGRMARTVKRLFTEIFLPRRIFGSFLLSLLLSGCGGNNGPPLPCPTTVLHPDARQMVRFNDQGRDLTDVLFEARIEDLALACDYDDGAIEAELRLRILAVRGPADRARKARIGYFVAIATREQEILTREEFQIEIPFPGNRTRIVAIEELVPRIPLKPGQSGADYLIYVGFVMTPGELQYNRANR